MGLKGTPAERREQKTQQRLDNSLKFHLSAGQNAATGHDKLVAATQAAKALSRDLTDEASRRMAFELVRLVERFGAPQNRRQP